MIRRAPPSVEDHDFGRWAFHATTENAVQHHIWARGLQPRRPQDPGMPFGADRPAVFFAWLPDHALAWGSVLLRFPMPTDIRESTWATEVSSLRYGRFPSEAWTSGGIPVEQIEIWSPEGVWRPLKPLGLAGLHEALGWRSPKGRRVKAGDQVPWPDHGGQVRLPSGPYWHITKQRRFRIGARRPLLAYGLPRVSETDLLYLTTQPASWHEYLGGRERAWAVEVDISAVPLDQIDMGRHPFEIRVLDPSKARVVRVVKLRDMLGTPGFGGHSEWLWTTIPVRGSKTLRLEVPRRGWGWADVLQDYEKRLRALAARRTGSGHFAVVTKPTGSLSQGILAAVHLRVTGDLIEIYDPRLYQEEEDEGLPDPGWERYHGADLIPVAAAHALDLHKTIAAEVLRGRWPWHPDADAG